MAQKGETEDEARAVWLGEQSTAQPGHLAAEAGRPPSQEGLWNVGN